MSDNEYNKRSHARMQQEIAEAETLRARYQQQLDNWWRSQREAAADEQRLRRSLDPFGWGHWR